MSRVFVLGNAGLDRILRVPRLPNPGETLVGTEGGTAPGGKGLNQAVVAARAGAAVHFCAPLGEDAAADTILAALQAESLAALTLPRTGATTDVSLLMVLPDGENAIVSLGARAAGLTAAQATAFVAETAPGDWLLMQGNLTAEATAAAIATAKARGARVMLNPAPLWWDATHLLGVCDIIVANRGEAATLAGDAAALHRAGAHLAIVTLGAEGCVAADMDGVRHHPVAAVPALDSTGCGDTFCGVLAASLTAGLPVAAAISRAQAAASLCAGRAGAFAALPVREEV